MTDKLSIGQLYPTSMGTHRPGKPAAAVNPTGATFAELLRNQEVHLSHHAEERLRQRGILLNNDQLAKISAAINDAASKGAKDSLLLMNDLAFIVNVKNKTVVTAMDKHSFQNNVFTKIDSAVIIS
jgi:flagellar operon protein